MARVVIVDDDSEFTLLVHELLEEEGMAVTRCHEEHEAVACMVESRPDLIILDIRMARPLSGLCILEQVQSHPDLAGIPVIICSAAARQLQGDAERLTADGVVIVYKPFELDFFLGAVRTALEKAGEPAVGCQ